MSKTSTIVGLGTAGTIISAGGAYMFGAFDSDKNLEVPLLLSDFTTPKGQKIIDGYFPGLSLGENAGTEWSASNDQIATNFLGEIKNDSKGRLVVNWERFKCDASEANANKWAGRIRWLWSFKNGKDGNKGLILYVSAKSSATADSKMDVEGAIYALERENEAGRDNDKKVWNVKRYKKMTTTPTIIEAFENNLPEVGAGLNKVKPYWGFTTDTDKLTKLCKSSDNSFDAANLKDEFKGSWIWENKSGESKKLMDWSKGDERPWLNYRFGDMNTQFKDLVKDISGVWHEEYFVNKELGVDK